MLARSVILILASISLQAGPLCNLGFAATGTAALSVSVTVEAGCQVSPKNSVAEAAAYGPQRWNSPVSVNCSLPAPYQVVYDRTPTNDVAALGSSMRSLTGRPATLQAYDRNHLERGGMLIEPMEKSESAELVTAGLPAEPLHAAHCAAEVADSGFITVTVIY